MTPKPIPVVLIGDSDISRWPEDLNPKGFIRNIGQSGATLSDVNKLIGKRDFQSFAEDTGQTCFVVCAGENDLGSGIPMATSEREMGELLETLLRYHHQNHILFLGPKFEPWLTNDNAARKAYLSLSNMQEKSCSVHPKAHFVDCLTMFCGDTASVPGARVAGRAQPEKQYFDADGLHLSRDGYGIWKGIVDRLVDDLK